MIYKKPIMLNDLIAHAWINSDAEYLATVNGYEIPERFTATFFIKDKGLSVQVHLAIRVQEEKPFLMVLRIYGAGGITLSFLEELNKRRFDQSKPWREEKYTQEELMSDAHRPVSARTIALVAKFQFQLLQKAVALAIENEATKREKSYSSSEIQEVEKALAKTLKRNVPTDSMLKDVARRYKKAEKAGDPLYEDIMRHYSISERRSRDLITMCRRHKEKLLPKKKAGRPSVDQTPTRKKGK